MSNGVKHDQGKLRYDLIPVEAQAEFVKVLTFGAEKYSDNGWKEVEPKSRYVAAAMRHIEAHRGGEKRDHETSLPHLAHAVCCLMFLLQTDLEAEKIS